jgi:hypothetical protein
MGRNEYKRILNYMHDYDLKDYNRYMIMEKLRELKIKFPELEAKYCYDYSVHHHHIHYVTITPSRLLEVKVFKKLKEFFTKQKYLSKKERDHEIWFIEDKYTDSQFKEILLSSPKDVQEIFDKYKKHYEDSPRHLPKFTTIEEYNMYMIQEKLRELKMVFPKMKTHYFFDYNYYIHYIIIKPSKLLRTKEFKKTKKIFLKQKYLTPKGRYQKIRFIEAKYTNSIFREII